MTTTSGPRVALWTLGCRVNAADTMALQEAFRERDAQLVDRNDAADIYVLNSCTVTHAADSDARKLARRFKRDHPGAKVVVTGCYAQISPDELAEIPEVDLVIGNDGKPRLADLALQTLTPASGESSALMPRIIAASDSDQDAGIAANKRSRNRRWKANVRPPRSHVTAMPESRTRPFLKVQDGCDYSCAFCIIPKARGVSRSNTVEEVEHLALRYAELGAQELVLTGIHLGHWGRDLAPRRPFWQMVQDLADRIHRDGRITRLRLGSVEPNEVTSELIDLVAEHPLLCEHFHVPLQSGDDDVLRRMRRLYDATEYRAAIAAIRGKIPDAAIGADVLVGHPGESTAAFANTRQLLSDLDVTYLHVFPWSARKGTPSAEMPGRVSDQDKAARVRDLVALSNAKRHFFHRRFVGRQLEVVVLDKKGDERRALSRNYIPLHEHNGTQSTGSGSAGRDGAQSGVKTGIIQRWRVLTAGAQRCEGAMIS